MPVSRFGFIAPRLTGFTLAVIASAWLPALPAVAASIPCGAAGIVLALWRRTALIGAALLGFAWATYGAQQDLAHRLAPCVEGAVVEVRGAIAGLPKASAQQVQFEFEPSAIAPWPRCAGPLPRRLRLTWFGAPVIGTGETWQLRLRLRAVRGYQNPGGFDYERWAFASRIDGTGSVRYGALRALPTGWHWDRIRALLRARIGALALTHTGIVLGLLTGDAGLMNDADWALFRATGTVHLMVISGLHLTIAATVGVGLGRAIARAFPRILRRRGSAWLGAASGTLFVTLYACVAGWGVPVQRAWLATVVVLVALTHGRRHALPTLFLGVCALVVALDPLAPLQPGFWLSFGAVAILLGQFAPRLNARSLTRDLIVAQIVLGCAMVPLLFAALAGVAWLGPIANLVAVPALSAAVVPVELLAAPLLFVWPDAGAWLFGIADAVVGMVVTYLRMLAGVDWTVWRGAAGPALLVSAIASGLLLMPLSLRHRVLLLPCVLLPAVPALRAVVDGEYSVTVLDVGQGLAVIVDTARHRLLYDAGPHFPSGLDLGKAVVLPALRGSGSARLDLAILSHADTDHVGGYPAVAAASSVRGLLGGEAVNGLSQLRPCRRGQRWQWDGVRFRMLHPARTQTTDNDASCVLLIDNGRRRALLPGDISTLGELDVSPLIGTHVDVLVVAHHGSRSSSSLPFVRRAMPRVAVISAGYMNRFGHPHAEVLCRLIASGARVVTTASSGAIEWHSQRPDEIVEWRRVAPPFWRVGIAAGGELSMNDTGIRQNTRVTRIDESCRAGGR